MAINFLELPAELRNIVYEMALLYKDPITPMLMTATNKDQCLYQTPLLRASKVINHETASMFYGQNCFDFTRLKFTDIPVFLGMIGQVNASRIRHIRIHFPGPTTGPIFIPSVRGFCTNLRTITITAATMEGLVFYHYCLQVSFSIAKMVEDANDLIITCGHHSGIKVEVEVRRQLCEIVESIVQMVGWEAKISSHSESIHLVESEHEAGNEDDEEGDR